MIKAVIFDIDNTLYDYDAANRIAFAALTAYAQEALGIGADEFRTLHDAMIRRLNAEMGEVAASHNRLIRYQHILEDRGLPLAPHALRMASAYWDTFLKAMVPYESALPLLELLRGSGIRTGICTNMTSYIQLRKLEKLGILKFFDFIVTSEEAGVEKPHREIFERSIRKAGCLPRECLFVGDSFRHDAEGALAAGMKTACLQMPGKGGGGAADPAVRVIGDLEQVAELVFEG